MTRAKIAITIDPILLETLDDLVEKRTFQNRSQAINNALKEKLDRLQRTRLELECKKLVAVDEQELAELGMEEDNKLWPTY